MSAVAVSHIPWVPNKVIGANRSWDRVVPNRLKRGRWVAETMLCDSSDCNPAIKRGRWVAKTTSSDSSDRNPAIKRKFNSDVPAVLKRAKTTECIAFSEPAPELPDVSSMKKEFELPEWEKVRHFVEQAQNLTDRECKWVQFLKNFERHTIQRYMDHVREDTFSSYIS